MIVRVIGFLVAGCLPGMLCGQEVIQFNRDVRPILAENCFSCHGFDAAKREAGLRLDVREGAIAELDSGEVAIRPSDPDSSELIRRIMTEDTSFCMPPMETGKRLSESQMSLLRKWIEQGARYESHWSFQPLQPVTVDVSHVSRTVAGGAPQHPIDLWIQQKWESHGLKGSPQAPLRTLLRRVHLDLIGLPPSIEELTAFEQDWDARGESAYVDRVESLLRNPHYGERWGRWWLDQARYADSHGYSVDAPRDIWLYRDWVVNAFNRDMPFDQFTIEQLAGDLLPNASEEQHIATGFHRNTQINQEGGVDPEQFRIESLFDRVATTGSVFLGLSVGCAQCHDHKFDPISQSEYYQFLAFFNQQDELERTIYPAGVDGVALQNEKKRLEGEQKSWVAEHADEIVGWEGSLAEVEKEALATEVKKIMALPREKRTYQHWETLYVAWRGSVDDRLVATRQRLVEIQKQLQSGVRTLVFRERKEARPTHRYIQGDFTRPAEEVQAGTPAILHRLSPSEVPHNRLDLAEWITSADNPLTARVMVNRVWQQFFGRGLVETENDFGVQGALPSHPELLDWLAYRWQVEGWSFKKLHRDLVLSATYRQSSVETDDLRERDPNNVWLARQQRLRLDAEIIRDVELSASGLLVRRLGGPPVFPPIPDGVMSQGQVKREWKVSQGPDRYRRGLYTFLFRATPPPSLNVFDAPEGNNSCTRRLRSNTPLQALTLLNDASHFEFAQALQKIIEQMGLAIAFERCTSRPPNESELAVLSRLDSLSAARVMLNLDETVTRE